MDRAACPPGTRHDPRPMRAVTFQAPGEVRLDERPEPRLEAPGEAVVRVEASGICGSDLHSYHRRTRVAPGFTIGHEFVGTLLDAGDAETTVAVGDRAVGCYQTTCGPFCSCRRDLSHKCDHSRSFGHGELLG